MSPRAWVVVVVLATVAYLVLAVGRGIALLGTGDAGGVVLGVAVLALPLVGAWVVWREVSFGRDLQRLGGRLAEEGGLPVDDLPRTPSGRVERDAADTAFLDARADVDADPADWRRWYRLGLAYDAARDRRRAREAMREAIRLARAEDPGR